MVAGAMVLALTGCTGGSSNSNSPATNTAANSSSPLIQAQNYAQEKTDTATLNQAVQQYRATEGHFPQSLQDLTPNYIAKIPQAPPGYQINYDANNGTVSVAKQ
jgi:hypothetical protein